jgi:hypothetical protein
MSLIGLRADPPFTVPSGARLIRRLYPVLCHLYFLIAITNATAASPAPIDIKSSAMAPSPPAKYSGAATKAADAKLAYSIIASNLEGSAARYSGTGKSDPVNFDNQEDHLLEGHPT